MNDLLLALHYRVEMRYKWRNFFRFRFQKFNFWYAFACVVNLGSCIYLLLKFYLN